MEPLLDVSRLARVCSSLIGILVRPHALRREWTHVNVQLEVQDRPVDSFHYDYVPFVFVTMLRKAPGDGTGALVLDIGGRGGKRNKKDGKERTEEEGGGAEIFLPIRLAVGESVLVQGSHVRHQANQSLAGCRVSLVVSLMPASVLHVDMTRVSVRGGERWGESLGMVDVWMGEGVGGGRGGQINLTTMLCSHLDILAYKHSNKC